MKNVKQISESIQIGIILALAGGFMDAYSYVCRGHVFANAQTGNILLLGISLADGNAKLALRYISPVAAFAIGIAISTIIRHKQENIRILHWRQLTLLIEITALCMVAFMPQDMNLIANSITSLACGIQVQSFRKIYGNGIATTMCIGNLRTATQAICDYYYTRDSSHAKKILLFYGIIIFFAIGAIIGNKCVVFYGEKAIVGSVLMLIIAFLIMFIDGEKNFKNIIWKDMD